MVPVRTEAVNGQKPEIPILSDDNNAVREIRKLLIDIGIANAVELAIASKHYASKFDRPSYDIIGPKNFCITGDGCLQERVTCDGPLDWIVTEDTNAKLRALGWNVIDVFQGDTSVADIVAALQLASSTCGKSTMVNIRTTIGGTVTAGTAKLHHGNYKEEDAALYASPSRSTHSLSEMTRDYFRDRTTIRQTWEKEWNWTLRQYEREYPDKARKLCAGMEDTVDVDQMLLKIETPDKVQATRPFNGVLFNQLMAAVPNMMAGDADLWNYGGYPPSCSHSP